MKFLVDECTGPSVSSWLRSLGYDVYSVYDQNPGMSDKNIIEKAHIENRIIIRMLYMDTKRHNLPHLHVEYQGMKSVISLPDGEIIEGELPKKKLRLVQAWIAIHEEELMANWALAVQGEPIFKIDPLR